MTLKVDREDRPFAVILVLVCIFAAAFMALAVATFKDEPLPKELPFSERFVVGVNNPYFPLEPGDTWLLKGTEGVTERITVLERYKEIQGVKATVVRDITLEDGKVAERTLDWYAQDLAGNVWYFGEATVEYEDGEANPAGSWEHGTDGAQAGILMPADPETNDVGWQERYPGEAESVFWVLDDEATKVVKAGRYDGSVRLLEWSPLEPEVIGEKYFAHGIGLISEEAVVGAHEFLELVKHE